MKFTKIMQQYLTQTTPADDTSSISQNNINLARLQWVRF